ncbi:MAG: hypothetical protein F6J89_03435 [Symploca sp. SIO1C4]|uniref:Uncharacterized protein n=1 Tax=Symploca sp. SIO1C4 TaxID=2607765 RepID=A0A6B3N7U0_9CYAN|nr:hypothetical protein [Symploca sp. SIO1C4]
MMTSKPSNKQTKAQILEAYDQLLAERKALETELKQLQKTKKDKAAVTPETTSSEAIKGMKQPQVVQDKMIDTINSLLQLQAGFGSSISELSEKLTAEAAKLEELRHSVNQEIQQLQELHDLEEIQEDTLDNLIQDYEDNSKAFEEESNQRQEVLRQDIQRAKKVWEKEQEEHQRLIKARNDEQSKTRQRDAQEYEYDLVLRRSLNNDQYQHNQQRLYRELEEAKQEQEKQWHEREQVIAQQEKEFAEMKAKVEAFEKEKEAAINKAKEEGKGIANYQVKVKADLQSKEIEGNKQFYELRIQALEQTIQNQEVRIQTLSQQLDIALKQVQDLAVKAIEGASNFNSYQALKEITLEQAKSQVKGK